MPTFPLKQWTGADYHHGPGGGHRYFGAARHSGKAARTHAACDLLAPPGAEVLAVADGTIISHAFYYLGTWQTTVHHTLDGQPYTVRYGEVGSALPKGLKVGSKVAEGGVIGTIVRNTSAEKSSMLHLEIYRGWLKAGAVTNGYKNAYRRNPALVDPTPFIDRWRVGAGR